MYFGQHGKHSGQGTFFVAFISATCNGSLQNYKITRVTVFVKVGGGGGLIEISERSEKRGGVTKIKQV